MTAYKSTAARSAAFAVFIALLMAMFMPLRAYADANAQFYIPDSAVPQGSQFTVSIEFTADENIGTVQAQVSYDESAIEFISSEFGVGGGGLINLIAFPDSASSTMMVTITFRALAPGSSQIDLIGGSVMSPDGLMLSNSIMAYAVVTVDAPQLPADSQPQGYDDSEQDIQTPSQPDDRDYASAQLSTITLSAGQLVPAFSPDVYDYTVTLPHEVEYLAIDAETADPNAGIWFEGSEYLADGIIPRTITVTSPDGMVVNVYNISVVRLGDGESEIPDDADEDEYIIPGNEAYSDDTDTDSDEPLFTTMTAGSSSSTPAPKDEKTGVEDLRDKLMPVLIVAMAAIVIAIIILVFWIRKKTRNRLNP